MKAPEKLYLRKRNKLPLEVVCDEWYKKDPQSVYGSVEYTRTDAFVEKACEWIKESVTNNPECNRIISKKGVITMGELIKDFRKYMKGE